MAVGASRPCCDGAVAVENTVRTSRVPRDRSGPQRLQEERFRGVERERPRAPAAPPAVPRRDIPAVPEGARRAGLRATRAVARPRTAAEPRALRNLSPRSSPSPKSPTTIPTTRGTITKRPRPRPARAKRNPRPKARRNPRPKARRNRPAQPPPGSPTRHCWTSLSRIGTSMPISFARRKDTAD